MKKIVTIIIAAVLLTSAAYSQAPAKMSYQSVVRNSAGTLLANSNVGIKISILQGSVSGTPVYVETHTKTSNANGLVSLEIGDGTFVSGSFPSINWAFGPYFIKTETDPTGGINYTISGTSQLLSVPYALYAETSGSSGSGQWNTDANGINYNAGNVGIGTGSNYANKLFVMGETNGVGSNVATFTSNDTWHSAVALKNNNTQYTFIVGGPFDNELLANNFGIYNGPSAKWALTINGATSNIGVGNLTPYPQPAKSTIHVFSGDVNIEQVGSGIIMKSPNGGCWRVTVSDTGNFVSTSITCP